MPLKTEDQFDEEVLREVGLTKYRQVCHAKEVPLGKTLKAFWEEGWDPVEAANSVAEEWRKIIQ